MQWNGRTGVHMKIGQIGACSNISCKRAHFRTVCSLSLYSTMYSLYLRYNLSFICCSALICILPALAQTELSGCMPAVHATQRQHCTDMMLLAAMLVSGLHCT